MRYLIFDKKKYWHVDSWSFGRHHFVAYAAEDGSRMHMTKGHEKHLLDMQDNYS